MPVPVLAAAAIGTTIAKTTAQKKAQKKAEEEASRQAEIIRAEQQRVEEIGGLTPQEREREQAVFGLETDLEAELRRRAGLTGERLLREEGPTINILLDRIASRLGMTGEELFRQEGGRVGQLLLEELSAPGPLDIFRPELELALQGARQAVARRGITPTGTPGDIGLEAMGRAAIEASINAARERLEQRRALATQLFNITAGARQEAGLFGERALEAGGGARTRLDQFLANLQNLAAGSRGRAAQTAAQAFNIAEPSTRAFGFVPIETAGFQAGQAAGERQQLLGGLADIGTQILLEKVLKPREEPRSETTKLLERLKGTIPGENIFLRKRGILGSVPKRQQAGLLTESLL